MTYYILVFSYFLQSAIIVCFFLGFGINPAACVPPIFVFYRVPRWRSPGIWAAAGVLFRGFGGSLEERRGRVMSVASILRRVS